MPIFVIFVFASIVFGAGAMLAPAMPTHGPRVGLSAALTLAFVIVGGLFWASLFGWDTLVIDYLWFTLLVIIFLGGTLSAGIQRAESKGDGREYGGWPGPRELAFFTMVALIFAAPALVLPVPLDTDAQGFGYLALMLRNSGSLTTLAPFHPEITYLYSPAFPALVAYLGHQLNAGLQNIQLALGAVLSVLFVWVAYDFGNELDRDRVRRTGIVMACCALLGTGLLTADLDSHYTALLALVFALAFVTFAIRFHREGRRVDFVAAAVTLAAVPLSQPDVTVILALGYVPWLATMWLATPRPTIRRWLGLAVGIPLLALIGIVPWLKQIAPLLSSDIHSPFEISASHLIVMIVYHGGVIVLLSLIGIVLAARRRSAVDLLMIVWLALILDFSSLGILHKIAPGLIAPLARYDYPFSIAWHGPIIPYIYFGGTAVLWLMAKLGRDRVERWVKLASLPVINLVALAVVVMMSSIDPLVAASKSTPLQVFGAFSSRADVQAMQWLEQNTAPDTLILNHPGPHEADWAPIVAQRNTIFFRQQPFFRNTQNVDEMQRSLRAFWQNPGDPKNADLLARYGIGYVLVPQIMTRPDALKTMFRWRPPLDEPASNQRVGDVSYLKLVFDADGAQVYQVIPTVAAR
jgi:hypothetical protein